MKKKEEQGNKKRKIIIVTIFLIILLMSVGVVIYYSYKEWKTERDMQNLADWINEDVDVYSVDNNVPEETEEEKNNKALLQKLNELKTQNSDLIGWITIEDTNIDYPVVQTNNNDFYVRHDFSKNYNELGTIFLDMECSIDKPTANFLIYGHRTTTGQMFETLTNYKDENFYKEHKTFKFATLNEVSEYKVIAVFMSKIYYKHQNVFKFYFFKDAKNEKEFNNYINNIKQLSMYPIEDTATYGEQLITLTTCDYYTENGRFVVVAKKVNSYINE